MDRQLHALFQQNKILKQRIDSLEELVLTPNPRGSFGFDPVIDPAPDGVGGGGRPIPFPPVADPSPVDFSNLRLVDLIRKFRGGVVDPVPEDILNVRLGDLIPFIPGGGVVDPAPEDFARLDGTQLKARLTEIDIGRKRLDQLEGMIKSQLDGE